MSVDPLLAPLAGTWRGSGTGEFPTMGPFPFDEEIQFVDIGSRDLVYLQRAWAPASGDVLHAEAGMWRATPEGGLVVTVAQPRRAEVSEGLIQDGVIELRSSGLSSGGGASPLTVARRRYWLDGDELTYEFEMATTTVSEPTRHLVGKLQREPGSADQSIVK